MCLYALMVVVMVVIESCHCRLHAVSPRMELGGDGGGGDSDYLCHVRPLSKQLYQQLHTALSLQQPVTQQPLDSCYYYWPGPTLPTPAELSLAARVAGWAGRASPSALYAASARGMLTAGIVQHCYQLQPQLALLPCPPPAKLSQLLAYAAQQAPPAAPLSPLPPPDSRMISPPPAFFQVPTHSLLLYSLPPLSSHKT